MCLLFIFYYLIKNSKNLFKILLRPPLAPVDAWAASAALGSTLFGANAYVLLRALNDVHYSVVMLNFGSFALVQTLLVSIIWYTYNIIERGYIHV